MISIPLPAVSNRSSVAIFIAVFFAVILAWLATPRLTSIENVPSLEDTVPRAFGDWSEIKSSAIQVSLSTGETSMDQPYDQVVMRAYRNSSSGQIVQLALAWGANQRQEVKIHRPDLCYVAQGFKVTFLKPHVFKGIHASGDSVAGKRMVASAGNRGEAVSYWIRIGNIFSESALETRLHILKKGIAGNVSDGILVRASIPVQDEGATEQTWALLDAFLVELSSAVPPSTQALLLGR